MMNRIAHPSEFSIAFCERHEAGSGVPAGRLPNRICTSGAWVDTGFRSAIVFGTPGKLSEGTKVFAIEVRGKRSNE